jgi:hypothetical protein
MGGLKRLFDRSGSPVTDFDATVVRSWLLNDIGEAIFLIPTSSIKCTEGNFKWGNYLYVEHDTLPDWVGVIDTPRPWGNGVMEVHAFEAASILKYRLPTLNSKVTGTPGTKVRALLETANGIEPTLIRAGTIMPDGVSSEETLTDTILAHLKKIQEASNMDWICTPVIDANGRLSITFDWLVSAGAVTDLELSQGNNVQYGSNPMEESGEVINYLEAMGEQTESTTLSYVCQDDPSIQKYGLRMARNTFTGITTLASLQITANEYLRKNKESTMSMPTIAVKRTVPYAGAAYTDKTFSKLRLGNVVLSTGTNVGFDATGLGASKQIRIEGMRYDEKTDTCEIMPGLVKDA